MTDKELAEGFWNNVKKALKDQNKTRHNFCRKIGVKEKTLSSMISRKQCPNIFLLTLIRNELRMECDELLYSFDSASMRVPLSQNEKRLIEIIRRKPEDKQNTIINAITAVLEYVENPAGELHIENVPEQQFQHVEVTISEEPPAAPPAPLPEEETQPSVPASEEPEPEVQNTSPVVAEVASSTATRPSRRRSTKQNEEFSQCSLFDSADFE